jgi:aldehyde dehydrogenase (NAD+)
MTATLDTRTELQLIGGERVRTADGRTIEVIGTVPRGAPADVAAAVDAAFPAWRDTSASTRGALIARWGQLVHEHEAELDRLPVSFRG